MNIGLSLRGRSPKQSLWNCFASTRNSIRFVILALLFLLFISGCANNKPSVNIEQEKIKYADMASSIVEQKGDVFEALEIYKKLLTLFEKDHEIRQKTLDYIMKESLDMVKSDNPVKIQKGLDVALGLDKIESGNFYVQNRIIYAYTSFAQIEKKKGNIEEAKKLAEKALGVRFDSEAMRLRLQILMEQAKDDVKNKKYEDAKKKLNEVIGISGLDNNVYLYKDEKAQAEKLLQTISSGP